MNLRIHLGLVQLSAVEEVVEIATSTKMSVERDRGEKLVEGK